MKRILIVITALCVLLCFVGCNSEKEGTSTTTSSTVTTTLNTADHNRVELAKLGFDAFMSYLNMCAAYNVPVDVNENDTIRDIVERLVAEGSDIEIMNIKQDVRYFDYAMENPNYGSGGGMYMIREDADWLALYVD